MPIAAIKVKGEYFPCTYQSDYLPEKNPEKFEAFISGTGWRKSKKGYYIPPIEDWSPKGFREYFEKWGKYVLMHAITGSYWDDGDYANAEQRCEVYSGLMMDDWDAIFDYAEKAMAINVKIIEICNEQIKGADENQQWLCNRHFFKVLPCHFLMYTFITWFPNLDVVADDKRLWDHWVQFHKIGDRSIDDLPVQMKARLTYLFSQEVSDMYEELMSISFENHPLIKPKEVAEHG